MSKLENDDANRKITDTPENRTWRQKYGAAMMLAVFALLAILMVVMQKKAAQ